MALLDFSVNTSGLNVWRYNWIANSAEASPPVNFLISAELKNTDGSFLLASRPGGDDNAERVSVDLVILLLYDDLMALS